MTSTTPDAAPLERTDHQSGYIVGPLYDWLLFLGTPIAALLAGFLISGTNFADNFFEFHGWDVTGSTLMLGVIVHAHLVAVFFRSHGNPKIFEAHPARFILVPIVLYAGMLFSPWIFVIVSVTATFWDVYHSGMQTFGFGRIYDRRRGNDPMVGRKLDWALNVLLYAGPIIGGAAMIDHFEDFGEFADVGDLFFTQIPAYMQGIHGTLTRVALAIGSLFITFYLVFYWRLSRRGYLVSWLKVWLYATTGFTSIFAWGFNAFGEAFFIMNLFHAIQYFGIVWAREKNQMASSLGLRNVAGGLGITLLIFLGLTGSYGYWVEQLNTDVRPLWAITLVVSIMHFWYDGFIWSVRRREV